MILCSPPFFPPKTCSCLALSLGFSQTIPNVILTNSSFIPFASSASPFHPLLNAMLTSEHSTVSKLTYPGDHLLVVSLISITRMHDMAKAEKFDQTAFAVYCPYC